jgi:DNA-directed RNA polymerase specialized sigma24 family protein
MNVYTIAEAVRLAITLHNHGERLPTSEDVLSLALKSIAKAARAKLYRRSPIWGAYFERLNSDDLNGEMLYKMCRALQKIGDERTGTQCLNFLFTVATNTIKNFNRAESSKMRSALQPLDEGETNEQRRTYSQDQGGTDSTKCREILGICGGESSTDRNKRKFRSDFSDATKRRTEAVQLSIF